MNASAPLNAFAQYNFSMSPKYDVPVAVMAPSPQSRKRKAVQVVSDEVISFDSVAPYESGSASASSSVTLSEDWKLVDQYKRTVHDLLIQPLRKLGLQDTHTMQLTKDVEAILDKQMARTVVVLYGDMASGKSATINSLHQCGGRIAPSGESGGSCTLTAHTYEYLRPNQRAPFAAEVCFFNRQERHDLLASYVADYYHAIKHDEDDDEAEFRRSVQPSEDDVNVDDIVSAFTALFADKRECQDDLATRAFLDSVTSDKDEKIISKITEWADHAINNVTDGAPTAIFTSSTVVDLLKKLEPFQTAQEGYSGDGTILLWPLVSVIRHHFRDPITQLGIVLLDVPGSSDSSRIRKSHAVKHKREGTHALIVVPVGRAIDDPSVARALKNVPSREKGRNVIVLTKSDDIKSDTQPKTNPTEKANLKQLQGTVQSLKQEQQVLGQEIASTHDREAQLVKRERKDVLDIKLHRAENEEARYRLQLRNKRVQAELGPKAQRLAKSNHAIPIVPVGNADYAIHLEGYEPHKEPKLAVSDCGIEELRRYICAFPNEARLNEAKFQHGKLLTTLEQIKMYASDTAVIKTEVTSDLEAHVEAPLATYREVINTTLQDFRNNEVKTCVTDSLSSQESIDDWKSKTAELCERWGRDNTPQQFLRLMKKEGIRAKQVREAVDMGATLIKLRQSTVRDKFLQLSAKQEDLVSKLDVGISGLVTTMQEQLEAEPNSPPMTGFFEYMKTEVVTIKQHIRDAVTSLYKDFDLVEKKLKSQDEEAYLLDVMAAVYHEVCQEIRSKGVPKPDGGWGAHRVRIFTARVGDVWGEVCTLAGGGFDEAVADKEAVLGDLIGTIFERIHNQFIWHYKDKELNANEDQVRKELRVAVKQAEEIVVSMEQALERMEKEFR